MSSENPIISQPNDEEINLKEMLFNYLRFWPWIVLSVLVFAVGGYYYLKTQINIFESRATVLVKDEKKGGLGSDLDIFSDLGIGGGNSNLYNEIEVFNSRTLMRDVARTLQLQESVVLNSGLASKDIIYYKDAPVYTSLAQAQLDSLSHSVTFLLKKRGENKVDIKEVYSNIAKQKVEKETLDFQLGSELSSSLGNFKLYSTPAFEALQKGTELVVTIHTLETAVDRLKANISIEAVNKDASALQIKHKGPVVALNNAIINSLIEQHEKRTINDKNEVTESTSDFIKQRMMLIEQELSVVEDSSEAFKFKNRLIDLESDAANYLSKEGALEQSITAATIQLSLADFMNEFIQKAKGYDELLPANLGFEDGGIATLTAEHNKLVLERNRLLQSSSAKNPMVSNLDGQIGSIRESLKESLNKLKQSLELQINILKKQEAIYKGKLSNVPEFEREYREILRQQQIKETLYLYLLQKREENEIAMASTLGSVKVLDYAYSSREPIAPKKQIIFLGAILLGLILPIGVIYVRDLLDTKVSSKEELERLGLPFIGQIPVNKSKEYIVTTSENRGDVSEAFRMLRTNLAFLLAKDTQEGKVIFSTSTIAGEGKTFMSINLANSMALTGKKVLLIGLDLRAPKISQYLGEIYENGITDYIVNSNVQIPSIIRKGKNNVKFEYILSGSVPPNPSELLLADRLKELLIYVKEHYDYIIVDTAPVGLVVDTVSILDQADVLLYVVRANYLDKKALDVPKRLVKDKHLTNVALVLNGVKMQSGVYGSYGYGYGYGNQKKSFWRIFK